MEVCRPISAADWEVDDVLAWLESERLSALSPVFRENEVDGMTLLRLTPEDIRDELRIPALKVRKQLYESIQKLSVYESNGDLESAIAAQKEEVELMLSQSSHDARNELVAAASSLLVDLEMMQQIVTDYQHAHTCDNRDVVLIRDNEAARDAQAHSDSMRVQEALDRDYIIRHHGQRTASQASEVPSLFHLAARKCIEHRINVHDALKNRNAKPGGDAMEVEAEDWSQYAPCMNCDPCPSDCSCSCHGMFPAPPKPVRAASVVGKGKQVARSQATPQPPMILTPQPVTINLNAKLPPIPTSGKQIRAPAKAAPVECTACFEKLPPFLAAACEHNYCEGCTRRLFENAMFDTSLLPVRCCALPIDPNIAAKVLPPDQAQEFIRQSTEAECINKMYCPISKCSQFINLDLIDDGGASDAFSCMPCPSCYTPLCLSCKSVAHNGLTCSEAQEQPDVQRKREEDSQVLKMAEEAGWKQCNQCKHIIARDHGCNHMTCKCGYEFCYRCSHTWKTCGCGDWEEDRLQDAIQQRVQQAQANAPRVINAVEAAARAERDLRRHVGCRHTNFDKVDWRGQCQEGCGWFCKHYAFRCGMCNTHVCYVCRFHRMR
jgi:hypothetical protein